ncbi:hypothetical protein LY76DRAFT_35475 [Colletotrichum caudatum]|nr:hypothetical protein LY76DRAFT_35475 [Colletotrichum caudatum]
MTTSVLATDSLIFVAFPTWKPSLPYSILGPNTVSTSCSFGTSKQTRDHGLGSESSQQPRQNRGAELSFTAMQPCPSCRQSGGERGHGGRPPARLSARSTHSNYPPDKPTRHPHGQVKKFFFAGGDITHTMDVFLVPVSFKTSPELRRGQPPLVSDVVSPPSSSPALGKKGRSDSALEHCRNIDPTSDIGRPNPVRESYS